MIGSSCQTGIPSIRIRPQQGNRIPTDLIRAIACLGAVGCIVSYQYQYHIPVAHAGKRKRRPATARMRLDLVSTLSAASFERASTDGQTESGPRVDRRLRKHRNLPRSVGSANRFLSFVSCRVCPYYRIGLVSRLLHKMRPWHHQHAGYSTTHQHPNSPHAVNNSHYHHLLPPSTIHYHPPPPTTSLPLFHFNQNQRAATSKPPANQRSPQRSPVLDLR